MTSLPQKGSKLRARGSLISKITRKDSIPWEWHPTSGRKISANDCQRLQILWERHYGIQAAEHPKSRAFSEPAIKNPLHNIVDALTSLSLSQSSRSLGTTSTVSISGTDATQRNNSNRLWQPRSVLWLQQRLLVSVFHQQVHETPTPGQ